MAFASSLPKLAPALFLSFAVFASLSVASEASAQSFDDVTTSAITRSYSDRGANENPLWISYDDCINDDAMTFSLGIRGNEGGYTLQVWAVADGDCSASEQRNDASDKCWLVFEDHPNDVKFDAKIPVRNIITQSPGSDGVVSTSRDNCEKRTTAAVGDNVTLWFILVDGSGELKGTAESYTTTVDFSGPTPPSEVEVSSGEERLQIKWTGNASTDLQRYDLYCVAAPATIASVPRYPFQANTDAGSDAGTTEDAGAGGSGGSNNGGSSDGGSGGDTGGTGGTDTDAGSDGASGASSGVSACGVTTLVQGERPPEDLETCGTASRTGGTATGLVNGVTYAVAVAGVDSTGNRGALSNIDCGTPEIVTDFYELYDQAGGKGGGGFCAIRPGDVTGKGLGAWGLFSLLGALCVWRRRAAR